MAQDLMRGGADLMSLAMLATRAQSAAHSASNSKADATDFEVLEALAGKLEEAAQSVQFFDSLGRAGSAPTGAVAAQIEVTIEAVVHEHAGDADAQRVAGELRRLADVARRLRQEPAGATDLAAFCSGLATAVLRQTRHVGEVAASL